MGLGESDDRRERGFGAQWSDHWLRQPVQQAIRAEHSAEFQGLVLGGAVLLAYLVAVGVGLAWLWRNGSIGLFAVCCVILAATVPVQVHAFSLMAVQWWQDERLCRFAREESIRTSVLSHARAVNCVNEALSGGAAYGVYLRNFTLEVEEVTLAPDRARIDHGLLASQMNTWLFVFESKLASHFRALGEIVTLANPGDSSLVPRGALPRIAVGGEEWTDVVEELLRGARFVVVHLSEVSTGLGRELSVIRDLCLQARTLVIVGLSPELTSSAYGSTTAAPELDTPASEMAGTTRIRNQLSDFPHVILGQLIDDEGFSQNGTVIAFRERCVLR